MHRSNPVSDNIPNVPEESQISNTWYVSHYSVVYLFQITHVPILIVGYGDVKNESPLLYTRQRDIHSVVIVLLQMSLGIHVMEKYPSLHDALITMPHFQLDDLPPTTDLYHAALWMLHSPLHSTLFTPHKSLSTPFTTPLHFQTPAVPHSI